MIDEAFVQNMAEDAVSDVEKRVAALEARPIGAVESLATELGVIRVYLGRIAVSVAEITVELRRLADRQH